MPRTITGTFTSGITLTSQADNPVTVAASARLSQSNDYAFNALYGQGGATNSWTIDNFGQISGGTQGGLFLGQASSTIASGTIINEAGGTLSGNSFAAYIDGPGSLTNMSGGTISAFSEAAMVRGSGTVVNDGQIIASSLGALYLISGGTVTNRGTISGAGGSGGVALFKPGTVENAGLISGPSNGYAARFVTASSSNRLIVDPGASFAGKVGGGTGTLELTSASSAGNLGNFGSSGITNFSTLQFDPGAQWTVTGNTSASGLGTIAITGFTANDTIDLTGFAATSGTFASNTLVLTDASSAQATLHIQGAFTNSDFQFTPDGSGGTEVTATCYAAGTRILTPTGEVPIERLREGDLVQTVSGRTQPIRWIGHRRVDFRRHPERRRILPVRIAAHAFGPGQPKRDLLLSPDHAVFLEDVLIPVRHLIDGRTVVQIECQVMTYYHIELPRHDVVLADGLPAESYLEAGARDAFANVSGVVQLHPQFEPPRDHYAMLWELHGYAPLVVAGKPLERVRRTIASCARPHCPDERARTARRSGATRR
jgi:hypothetical protein